MCLLKDALKGNQCFGLETAIIVTYGLLVLDKHYIDKNARTRRMITTPYLSVIIPTYRRNESLAHCLDCLKHGKWEADYDNYEVIVTDDDPAHGAKVMVETSYSWVRWVAGPHRGPAANRNNGACNAKGEWLVFLDDDCLPDKVWLDTIQQAAASGLYDIIEGKTIAPDKSDNPFQYSVENLNGGVYWSCNLAIRAQVFWQLGGFDEDFLEAGGEDMELAYRIKSLNLKAQFFIGAIVIHSSRKLTWKSLLWRTFLIRWHLLYRLKIGQGPPINAEDWQVITSLWVHRFIDLLRTTWHLISKHQPGQWQTQLFNQIWKWLTFPVVLPYLTIWELRFRKTLRNRGTIRKLARPISSS